MTALGTPGFALKRGRYLLNTDGGMRRSSDDEPGEAAIGVVLNEPGDRPVTTFKQRIGTETIRVRSTGLLSRAFRSHSSTRSARFESTSTTSL